MELYDIHIIAESLIDELLNPNTSKFRKIQCLGELCFDERAMFYAHPRVKAEIVGTVASMTKEELAELNNFLQYKNNEEMEQYLIKKYL